MMRKFKLAVIACFGVLVAFAEMPRNEWMAKVGECATDVATLKSVVKQLSPADQCAFLGEVNAAIAKLPGSQESRAAAFLAANRAALVASSKGNRTAMLAEVFATVPPEALTVLAEEFAATIFSRKGDSSRVWTDDDFLDVSTNAFAVIVARTASVESSAVRNAFAIVMFVGASGGTPANLADVLADMMPAGKDLAKKEWLPQALGKEGARSYDAMLGAAQADEEPNHAIVVQIAGTQVTVALLGDLQTLNSKMKTPTDKLGAGIFSSWTVAGISMNESDLGILRTPRTALNEKYQYGRDGKPLRDSSGRLVKEVDGKVIVDEDGMPIVNPYYNPDRKEAERGGGGSSGGGTVIPTPEPDPGPYGYQSY